jgi:hypothetical protein
MDLVMQNVNRFNKNTVYCYHIQGVPGGKVRILGGHNIGHTKQNSICTCVLLRTVSEVETFHCTVVQ